jgi:phage virion morphogenesis protein
MAELEAIEPFLHELMDGLQPAKRKRLIDKLMRLARRSNAKRIAANVTPDGQRMAPRKQVRPGQRKKMFTRIGKQNSLRIRATADEGELRFANGLIQDTAATHHFGLTGFVGRTRQGRVIRTKYQARELLGFGPERAEMLDEALKHLAGG